MKKIIKKSIIIMMCICLVTVFSVSTTTNVDAKATKKAMKVLKGNWVTVGNSKGTRVVFTTKYVKFYSMWNSNHTKVKKTGKGKYIGKGIIVSTKKKGKNWYVKCKDGMYYIGNKKNLVCKEKKNGKWISYASDSLTRY